MSTCHLEEITLAYRWPLAAHLPSWNLRPGIPKLVSEIRVPDETTLLDDQAMGEPLGED